jgi:F-type H+-transporting ATPase subunit 8
MLFRLNSVLSFINKRIYWIEKKKMPQLIPFFFVNQLVFNFFFIVFLVYIFTKYILPRFVRLFKTRLHINNF